MAEIRANVRVEYSPNFFKSFDKKHKTEEIQKRLFEVAELHRTHSNNIAPIDTSNLRRGSKTFAESPYVMVNEWFVVYANRRYYQNNKNPKSKKWAEQAFAKNKALYNKMLGGKK